MLRYDESPGLVALYDIQPGNGSGPFLQPWSPHGVTFYRANHVPAPRMGPQGSKILCPYCILFDLDES